MAYRSKSNTPAHPLSAKELVDKYSGVGLQFRVKFVGSENIDRKRGDAEAAKYCLPTLKIASQQSKIHKPKAAFGLSLKGISLYDETTKSITRVPLEKVTYISHDPVDPCYIGVIISDKDSNTGFKLYCFKAEKQVAICIVNSARELFELIFKLRQAKKKIKEEKEKAEKELAEANKNPDHSNLPSENAPPPSYTSVSDQQSQQQKGGPPEKPPPPRPIQPPPLPPRDSPDVELFSLEPPPSNSSAAVSHNTTTTTAGDSGGLFAGFEDLNLYEPPPIISQPSNTSSGGNANPFAPLPTSFNNDLYMQHQPPQQMMNQQQQFGVPAAEPSITMDLMDAIKNPAAGTTSYNFNPMGMGGGMGIGAGMGMGTGMGTGAGMGMGVGNLYGGGSAGFGQQQQPNPQVDIFSLPSDPLMNSNFSQPLLPAVQQQQQQNHTANSNKTPQQYDAFSGLTDLVNIAKTKASKPSPQPPRYSVLYKGEPPPTESTDSPANDIPPPPNFPPPATEEPLPTIPQSSNQGGGFDDFWNNSFGGPETTTTQAPPDPPSKNEWVSF